MFILFIITQHTSKTEAQVCLKNYNSDVNNNDVITVDYMVTGGRQSETFYLLIVKNELRFENKFDMSFRQAKKNCTQTS